MNVRELVHWSRGDHDVVRAHDRALGPRGEFTGGNAIDPSTMYSEVLRVLNKVYVCACAAVLLAPPVPGEEYIHRAAYHTAQYFGLHSIYHA
jgi:hypothetical protein